MSNWLAHVKKTMSLNPGKPLKEVLKMAKATYKKGVSVGKYAVTGKKSRTHRRKRKTGKKAHKKSVKKAHKKTAKKSRRSRRR